MWSRALASPNTPQRASLLHRLVLLCEDSSGHLEHQVEKRVVALVRGRLFDKFRALPIDCRLVRRHRLLRLLNCFRRCLSLSSGLKLVGQSGLGFDVRGDPVRAPRHQLLLVIHEPLFGHGHGDIIGRGAFIPTLF